MLFMETPPFEVAFTIAALFVFLMAIIVVYAGSRRRGG
jgi:hypothetical protein